MSANIVPVEHGRYLADKKVAMSDATGFLTQTHVDNFAWQAKLGLSAGLQGREFSRNDVERVKVFLVEVFGVQVTNVSYAKAFGQRNFYYIGHVQDNAGLRLVGVDQRFEDVFERVKRLVEIGEFTNRDASEMMINISNNY